MTRVLLSCAFVISLFVRMGDMVAYFKGCHEEPEELWRLHEG
jgi:hypothetical protein